MKKYLVIIVYEHLMEIILHGSNLIQVSAESYQEAAKIAVEENEKLAPGARIILCSPRLLNVVLASPVCHRVENQPNQEIGWSE